jgi:hypothetical protein
MNDAPLRSTPASVEAAEAWFADAAYEEWELAWGRVEPAYRRVLAERVVENESLDPDDPETAAFVEGAAEEGHDEVLWSGFGEEQCWTFLKAVVSHVNNRAWIIRPMPVALDCELVLLIDQAAMRDGAETGRADWTFEILSPVESASPPTSFTTNAALFYMRRDSYGEWLIAGFNEEPPDWPAAG